MSSFHFSQFQEAKVFSSCAIQYEYGLTEPALWILSARSYNGLLNGTGVTVKTNTSWWCINNGINCLCGYQACFINQAVNGLSNRTIINWERLSQKRNKKKSHSMVEKVKIYV